VKFLDEYREAGAARKLAEHIARAASRPWTMMEVCGGQTHSIVKYGLSELLPPGLELLHGPGCPVCVTPLETIDKALALAAMPGLMLCSFGDMLRVPGSHTDLLRLKSQGADVRVIYSPLDALALAEAHPQRKVVLFAIGFETTAPATAKAAALARRRGITNFSLLVSHVRVPPALRFVLQAPGNRVQAFLGPGHVCSVMGLPEYQEVSAEYRVPIVITGFEPVDLLEGILRVVEQLERGEARVENQYARVVRPEGNLEAQKLVQEVFCVCDRAWRGIGVMPRSGLALTPEYRHLDAERLGVLTAEVVEPAECLSGEILIGLRKPPDCPAFGRRCTPLHPLGATMVSSEGACAAYFQYRQLDRVRGEAAETKL
jgi:hydrogenase expression/formation protein HypD